MLIKVKDGQPACLRTRTCRVSEMQDAADRSEATFTETLRKMDEGHQKMVDLLRNVPVTSPSFELIPRFERFFEAAFEVMRSAVTHVRDATGRQLIEEWQKSGPHSKKESAQVVERVKLMSAKMQELSRLSNSAKANLEDFHLRFVQLKEQGEDDLSFRQQILKDAEIAIEPILQRTKALVAELDVERSNLREFFKRQDGDADLGTSKSKWKFRS
jgi:hypothetical protein